MSLASGVASAVAAVRAITHYRTDSADPDAMFALLLGTLDVALGIGGYVRYLGSGSTRRQGPARRAGQRTELGVEPPGVLGAS